MKRLTALLGTLLLLALAACGGADQAASLERGKTVAPAAAAKLPPLPGVQRSSPSRITAAFEATRKGNAAWSISPGVSFASTSAVFAPGSDELQWALYRFDAVPEDLVTALSFNLSGVTIASQAWFAVSDYQQGSWSFLPSQTASGSIPLSFAAGQNTSPSGQIYVAVAAFDNDAFNLLDLSLEFANRYPVSGQVHDELGNPISGALISTTLDDEGVFSDAGGNFTLPTIPDGTWHIMATKDSHVFYNNPQEISVSGAALSGVEFTGYRDLSHLTNFQGPEPNNDFSAATVISPDSVTNDSVSVVDDDTDWFRVSFAGPGPHYVKVTFSAAVLFPEVNVYDGDTRYIEGNYFGQQKTIYLPLPVFDTPAERLIEVVCQGGGGSYTLSFGTDPLNRLEGDIVDNSGPLDCSLVKVDISDGLDEISFLSTESQPAYSLYLPPNIYVVTPSDPDYDFNPLSQNANLALGDQLDVDFSATASSVGDSFEPNDDAVGAEQLTLPFSSTPGTLAGGGMDTADFYRVLPAAGKFMRARLTFEGNLSETQVEGVQLDILSETEIPVSGFGFGPGYWESRTSQPCVDDPYYVRVLFSAQRKVSYSLLIEEFDGTTVQVTADIDGTPLPDVRISNYILPQGLRFPQYDYTDQSGQTSLQMGIEQGEQLGLEAYRFGMDIDRHTQILTAGPDPLTASFSATAAASTDKLEPNGFFAPVSVSVPLQLEATVDDVTDEDDMYEFASSGETYRLSYSADPGLSVSVIVNDQANFQLANVEGTGGDIYFKSGSSATSIRVFAEDGFGRYQLSCEAAPAFFITGTVTDDVPAESNPGFIKLLGTALTANYSDPDGQYVIGPVPPGDYNLVCIAPNYMTDNSPVQVSITNADAVQNFDLIYVNQDANEPNNDDLSAVSISDNSPISGNLDTQNPVDGSDTADWYKFTASGPGVARLSFSTDLLDMAFPDIVVSYATLDKLVSFDQADTNGQISGDFYIPAAGTYFVRVVDDNAIYSLSVNFP